VSAAAEPDPKKVAERSFEFTYGGTVTGLKAGEEAKIWLPVPSTTGDQVVKVKGPLPRDGTIQMEPISRNRVLYFEGRADKEGKVAFQVAYRIKRREVKGQAKKGETDGGEQIARFLRPDALVPISGKPVELIKGKKLPRDSFDKAKVFYDVVNNHMRYSKEGKGWGRGDSVWACDSKFGNCSDFHSLFISLARSQKIPAKFEIGFPLPEKRGTGEIGGYHCWAFFRPEGKGWVPVDISEANKVPTMRDYYFGNLTENRVAFSTGRDLDLVPKQAGPPLNFFIYPYVEVGGKPWPQEKIGRKFSYRDVK
jgi:transglutaminase-like putative cysteine protease